MKHTLPLFALSGLLILTSCNSSGRKAATLIVSPEPVTRIMDTVYVTEAGCTIERFRMYSDCMGRYIKAAVVLPQVYQAETERKFPVLYTLHGAGAPYNTYAEMSLLQAQLKNKPFIYTCFDGDDRSMYIDSKYPVITARRNESDTTKRKSLFTTFFFSEFIPAIDEWYRVDGSKRALTGFSMGGFGALHYALVHPEMFCSVSGLSSTFMDVSAFSNVGRIRYEEMLGSFKDNKADYEALDHYLRLAELKKKGVHIPPIFLHCGTEDFLLNQNRKMKAHLDSLNIINEYKESPGEHNWKFWHPASVGVAEFHWKYF